MSFTLASSSRFPSSVVKPKPKPLQWLISHSQSPQTSRWGDEKSNQIHRTNKDAPYAADGATNTDDDDDEQKRER